MAGVSAPIRSGLLPRIGRAVGRAVFSRRLMSTAVVAGFFDKDKEEGK